MTPQPGHGLDELLGMLNELDGRHVHATVHGRPIRTRQAGPAGSARADIEEIERIAARVTMTILDYKERRR